MRHAATGGGVPHRADECGWTLNGEYLLYPAEGRRAFYCLMTRLDSNSLARQPLRNSPYSGIMLAVLAVVLWSTVPVGTRLLVQGGGAFSVGYLSAMRLWIAAIIFIVLRLRYVRRSGQACHVPLRSYGWLLIAAAGISLNYLFYGIGLRFTTAGVTSVITQLQSPITILLAAALLGERLTLQKVLGMIVGSAGVLLVIFHGVSFSALFSSSHFLGNLLEVVASMAWPWYAIGQTKLLQKSGNQQALEPIFLVAALMSTLFLPFTGPLILHVPTLTDWVVLIFLGAGSTAAAYWLFALSVQRLETSVSTMFNVLIPPLALLMAHWMLGEQLHAQVIGGLVLVVLGLVLVVWRRQHTSHDPSAACHNPA